jgi:glutamine synthetase
MENLVEKLKDDTRVKLAGIDADGVLRGKVMDKDKFISALKTGFGFCR